MNTRAETRNLADYIIIGVLIINVILAFILKIANYSGLISFINISVTFMIISIVSPANDYIKRGILKNKLVVLSLIIKGVLLTIFIISLYKILISTNYNLKYTYWIELVALILIMTVFFVELLFKDYKKRKLMGKKYNVLYVGLNIIFIVLIAVYIILKLVSSFNHPQRNIVLEQVKTPQYISIYKYGDNEAVGNSFNLNSNVKITEPELIDRIIRDISSRRIENITSTELLNYERMKSNNNPYYLMMFGYIDTSDENKGAEIGYIHPFVITSNRYVVMEVINSKKGLLLDKNYNEIYPISLSQETIDMIFEYLD